MKYLLCLFLIICFASCSHSGEQAVKNMGKQVSKCCGALTIIKSPENDKPAATNTPDSESMSVFTEFILEKSVHILTH